LVVTPGNDPGEMVAHALGVAIGFDL